MQVHDELVFEVPTSEVKTVQSIVKTCMESCYPLSVPLVVDVGVGDTWFEAH